MQKLVHILFFVMSLFYIGCSNETETDTDVIPQKQVTLKLFSQKSLTKVVDEDNLEVEQTIKNITVFFTDPSSNVFTHKYINSGFTTVDDYRVVSIPLDPAELQSKDIYVVTNYGNASFNSINTLDELKVMTTPTVNKTNNLDPANGICMYGKTLNFDFANATGPAIVYAVRTAAKFRVTLSFPEDATLSTNNSFLITGAASYTYIVKGTGATIPSKDYFDFAAPITLAATDAGTYTNQAYVYEATQDPALYLYTHINNSATAQEYSVNLPMPARNYLYDIKIEVYNDATKSANISGSGGGYTFKKTISVFDEYGQLVETL